MELVVSPNAGFDRPLRILDACHVRILRYAQLVRKVAQHLDSHPLDDQARHAARFIVRFFDDAGCKHHRDEEEDLFPALNRNAAPTERPAIQSLLRRLRDDHVQIDAQWRHVRVQLMDLLEGRCKRIDLASADAFLRSYERHIAIEEIELLPLAKRLLGHRAIVDMGNSMAARRGLSVRVA